MNHVFSFLQISFLCRLDKKDTFDKTVAFILLKIVQSNIWKCLIL